MTLRPGILFAFLLVLAGPLFVSAQHRDYFFTHYTTANGLAGDQVLALTRDRDGFLWVGATGGLHRFDGKSFRAFHRPAGDGGEPAALSVTGLAADPGGRLWVSTREGLYSLDPVAGTFRLIRTPEHADSVANNEWATRLTIGPDGTGWFCTARHLIRLNLTTERLAAIPLPVRSQVYYATHPIEADREGYLWLTSGYELLRYDPAGEQFRRYGLAAASVSGNPVYAWSVAVGEDGQVWCGTRDHGLFAYHADRDTMVRFLEKNLFARSLLPGRDRIWIGGGKDGLYRLDRSDGSLINLAEPYGDPYSHNGSWVNVIFRDPATGIIWLGTQEGLEKYDPGAIRFQRVNIPLQSDLNYPLFVLNIVPDRTDSKGEHFWLKVIERGLFRWNRRTNAFEEAPPDGDGPPIGKANECLLQDREGRLWVNQYNDPQLKVYDPQRRRWSTPALPAGYHDASYLYEDRDGRIWIGAFDNRVGVYDLARRQLTAVPFFESLTGDRDETDIVCISQDRQDGTVWVITEQALYRVDGGSLDAGRFPLPAALAPGTMLLALHVSRAGDLWLGTRDGAFRLDRLARRWHHYARSGGLLDPNVYQVVEDPEGHIWLGTASGLYRWDAETQEIRSFTKSDGLISNSTFFLSVAGDLLFVGQREAFNYGYASRFTVNRTPPPVVISEVWVMDKERRLAPGEELTLRPGENHFTVRFAALNFRQSEKNTFAYRLEGFEENWHFAGTGNTATYTNLDGGRYRFQVRAANNDGIWNETGATLDVRVRPPFHRTWAFLGLLALGLGGILGALWWYRRQQRRRTERIRDRIARDLHDDMGSTISSIRFFSECIQATLPSADDEARPLLDRISAGAASLSEAMKDIVWTMNSREDRLDDLVLRMREFGARVLEAKQIRFVAHTPPQPAAVRLAIEQRRNLYLIFKEALTNAVKYSGCTELELSLASDRHGLGMEIRDNGRGFDPAAARRGNGLLNMERRAAEMGGTAEIFSAPGQGTRIVVRTKRKQG